MCAPARPPANCPTAMGSATCQSTRLRVENSATAARFEAKFTTLASAEASRIPAPKRRTKAKMRKVPVPGPKKPS